MRCPYQSVIAKGCSWELTDLALMYIITVKFEARCGGGRELMFVLLYLRDAMTYCGVFYR